jgi:outer membrane protein OmpA-like peptidoglycan-associated protein
MLIVCLKPLSSSAQNFYGKVHKSSARRLTRACDLPKKRSKKNHKPHLARHHKHKTTPMAERTITTASVTRTTPQPKTPPPTPEPTRPAPEIHKVEKVDDKKLEQLHHKEDEVLAENKLPKPSSEKHEQVRKMVADKIKNKPNSDPITLAPLYFTFDQDEFSIVDMEPFLVATEYALQGHTVLIEGHTDSRGADDYNVQLSIKRVQKIRQLMLDMGVPDDRISVVGYGEEMKSNNNKTTEGRQLNRRVDFTVF